MTNMIVIQVQSVNSKFGKTLNRYKKFGVQQNIYLVRRKWVFIFRLGGIGVRTYKKLWAYFFGRNLPGRRGERKKKIETSV